MQPWVLETGAGVAPHAGAWIETCIVACAELGYKVAPHAGAWIETLPPQNPFNQAESRPTRARGLKPDLRRLGPL
jgi:hypothetical protein